MPNKTVTQVPVTQDDLLQWTISYDEEGAVTCVVTYRVRDSAGAQIGNHKAIQLTLAQNEQAQLNGFTHATVLKGCNAAEGT